jgi:hypothetical protein
MVGAGNREVVDVEMIRPHDGEKTMPRGRGRYLEAERRGFCRFGWMAGRSLPKLARSKHGDDE